jgi:hypothetical protein
MTDLVHKRLRGLSCKQFLLPVTDRPSEEYTYASSLGGVHWCRQVRMLPHITDVRKTVQHRHAASYWTAVHSTFTIHVHMKPIGITTLGAHGRIVYSHLHYAGIILNNKESATGVRRLRRG